MFHDGDLQSGISRAIQEKKLVVCFVRGDENEESDTWEGSYLASSEDAISPKAVLLKIDAGSQGASFLNAFCPISAIPTLVIINNGQVLEKLEGEISQDEFTQRLHKALGVDTQQEPQSARESEPTEASEQDTPHAEASTPSPVESSEASASQQASQSVQGLFPGRAERLEAENQKRQTAEKAERAARAKARRKEVEAAESAASETHTSKTTTEVAEKERARQTWLNQQKQRKEEARQERLRILDAIENDKQERKSRAAREKAQQAPSSTLTPSSSLRPAAAGSSDSATCSLQIRLFDGTSIRTRLSADHATLATDVRAWIAATAASPEALADGAPYTFRWILAPAPSRAIEVSEEHRSLRELGLVPNCTLVLVPVQGAASAYAGAGGGGVSGYLGSVAGAAYGLAGAGGRVLSSVLAYLPGWGGEEGRGAEGSGGQSGDAVTSSAERAKGKVNTLADQRAEAGGEGRKAEFYNGNSSAFEGRKDEDDK